LTNPSTEARAAARSSSVWAVSQPAHSRGAFVFVLRAYVVIRWSAFVPLFPLLFRVWPNSNFLDSKFNTSCQINKHYQEFNTGFQINKQYNKIK
jgi:hypothetical protein